jgi:hypothetical protein
VAILILGIAYINSDENKIKSRIGETYNFESNYGSVEFNGSAKIISADKLSLKIRITADEENVINTNVDSTIIFKLRDEENFPLGEFRVSGFTRVNYNSDTQTVSGYAYDDIVNISYDLKPSLIKAAEITPNSYIGFETISHSDLQKNKEAAQREAVHKLRQKEAAQREAAQREAAQREAEQREAEPKKTESPKAKRLKWLELANWRALSKDMSISRVKQILGSPTNVSGGPFSTYTYSGTVNYKYCIGIVTFYKDEVYSWNEPTF